MPTFPLKDGFGLNVAITPGPGALLKYFKSLPDFNIANLNLAQLASKTLADAAAASIHAGLNFSSPIQIGSAAVALEVAASLCGTLALFVPGKDPSPLFDPDPFGDTINVPQSERYVSLALHASVCPSTSNTTGDLTFGFTSQAAVDLAYYKPFPAGGTTVIDAVVETLSSFAIPADLSDIEDMPEGAIATVEGSGQLTFSGSVNLLTVTNPLASATLPVAGTLGITAGAQVSIGASYTYAGDYQVRVQRLPGSLFRLGFYRKRETDFTITASASASVGATLGSTDLLSKLVTAISANPQADLKSLEQAGLPADQAAAIQSAIKCAIDRSLSVGVTLELANSDVSDAMFLYQVDLNAARTQPGAAALLHDALTGDLTGLVSADDALPAGITVVKTLVTKTKTFQHSLKVNLLGIDNFLQLSSLIVGGKAAWDATTGEVILTDQITASKIGIAVSNLQADSQKLRSILAQQFLITAAYRAIHKVVESGPTLAARQSYSEMQTDANPLQVRNDLLTAASLGFQTVAQSLARMPRDVAHFGKETVYAEAAYTDAAFRSLFLANGVARSVEDYLAAGRKAITLLVQPGDPDEFRRILATNDALFATLRANGNTQSPDFKQALTAAGVPASRLTAAGVDFSNIVWLAKAMTQTAAKLLAIDKSPDVPKLRQELADQIGAFAQQATTDFGGPWGFHAMALLGSSSSQKWLLTNAHITGVFENAPRVAHA